MPVAPGLLRPAEGRPWGSLDGPGHDATATMTQEAPQGFLSAPMSGSAGEHPRQPAARGSEGATVTDLEVLDVTAVRVLARYFVELTFAGGRARHRSGADGVGANG